MSEAGEQAALGFYFDFVSPYAYLAHDRLTHLCARYDARLDYRIVNLEQLKARAGNTAPPTRAMPLKLKWARADLARWAERYGLPFRPPAGYGSNRANRGFFHAVERGAAAAYVRTAWNLIWGEGGDMGSDDLLRRVAAELGWDGDAFLSAIDDPLAEELYQRSTDAAHDAGVFGVPTMILDGEFWWGNDRLDFVEEALARRAARQ